jgi:hypothetical protein
MERIMSKSQKITDVFAEMYVLCVISTHPPVPEVGKWTKLGPTLDYHVSALMGSFFHGLVVFALREVHWAKDTALDENMDENLRQQVSWHQVAGKKYKQTEAALGAPTYFLILALVTEATRHLIQFHMAASHNHIASPTFAAVYADGGATRHPPILDLMHPNLSILVSVLQYMSTILCRPTSWSRITLLLRHRNVESVEQLLQCYPADIQLLQLGLRSAMVANTV